jgi:hypothetical protein
MDGWMDGWKTQKKGMLNQSTNKLSVEIFKERKTQVFVKPFKDTKERNCKFSLVLKI